MDGVLYQAIDKNKYIHKTVNHTKEFVNKEDKTIHTNTIENVWRNVRRYFKVYNGVRKNFNLFLQEVIFKINYTCYNSLNLSYQVNRVRHEYFLCQSYLFLGRN